VQLLRHLGLAARFVSGYLIQLTADVKSLDGPPARKRISPTCMPGARCICRAPAGSVSIPTSACLPAKAISPGVHAGTVLGRAGQRRPSTNAKPSSSTRWAVTRIWEAPRVTKPYTDEQWQAIENLGHQIDKTLGKLDVRLTQGGEPTFVAVDDPDGAEWNTDRDGADQAHFGRGSVPSPARKVRAEGLVHFGQGKWYPGEQLPALVAELLLAQGWRADLEFAGAVRRRKRQELRGNSRTCRRFLKRLPNAWA
jgi:hypothetical protein